MSDPEKIKFQFTWTDHARKNLDTRIKQFDRNNGYYKLDSEAAAIYTLRGIEARASHVLPALYLALGAFTLPPDPTREHWQTVQAEGLEQTSLHTIALACRAIFDEDKSRLSGKRIARLSDETLASVARHWSGNSRSEDDAIQALRFFRSLFTRCAQPRKQLTKKPSLLEPRIGLLKYYADRHAAHITEEYYEFAPLDLVHVVAAIVVIGAIIADFDNPRRGDEHFDYIDEAGWRGAKEVFPLLPINRIFSVWRIHRQATVIWREQLRDGVEYILNQLPAAIGWWDSELDPE
jgi:hypothetical protein